MTINAANKYLIKLDSGSLMPQIGLGTWHSDPGDVGSAVEYALTKYNYRHLDCAARYGNEPEIGQSLKKIFSSQKLKREEIFITSKLWNSEHAPDKVEKACRQTLKDLNLDYLDLYLVHWGLAFTKTDAELDKNGTFISANIPLHQTWEKMEQLVKKGLVKNIGVANFTAPMLLDLLAYAKIKPTVNQIEIHPYNPQTRLVKFCHDYGIAVTCYSPLGSPGHFHGANIPVVLKDQAIVKIADTHHKSPAQVILRWDLQRNTIAIPKSVHPEHIKANIDLFDFELTREEMQTIGNLPFHHRYLDPADWWGVPYFD